MIGCLRAIIRPARRVFLGQWGSKLPLAYLPLRRAITPPRDETIIGRASTEPLCISRVYPNLLLIHVMVIAGGRQPTYDIIPNRDEGSVTVGELASQFPACGGRRASGHIVIEDNS